MHTYMTWVRGKAPVPCVYAESNCMSRHAVGHTNVNLKNVCKYRIQHARKYVLYIYIHMCIYIYIYIYTYVYICPMPDC